MKPNVQNELFCTLLVGSRIKPGMTEGRDDAEEGMTNREGMPDQVRYDGEARDAGSGPA